MDTKHIHCMLEDVAKYGKDMVSCMVGDGNVNLQDLGEIIDIVKDLACAEKDALIAKEMRKANEEDEAEEKHFLKMLKDEYKDELKKMKEEYGEDEGERRFYDNYRYKSSGRFAPKGSGSYMPRSSGRRGRRGYEEPMYFLPPEVYTNYSPEELRDMDRAEGRMYYGGGSSGGSYSGNSGNTSGQSGNSGMSGGNSGGNSGGSSRGYSEGYADGQTKGFDEGQRRGYEDGYRDGESRGRSQGGNSRYDRAKRGYEETKEKHKGNTPEDKRMNMAEFEKVLNIVLDEIDDMLQDAPQEMKNMAKTKGMARLQKIS